MCTVHSEDLEWFWRKTAITNSFIVRCNFLYQGWLRAYLPECLQPQPRPLVFSGVNCLVSSWRVFPLRLTPDFSVLLRMSVWQQSEPSADLLQTDALPVNRKSRGKKKTTETINVNEKWILFQKIKSKSFYEWNLVLTIPKFYFSEPAKPAIDFTFYNI